MKNLIYSVFAIAILAMTTSCQKEETLPQVQHDNPGVLAIPPSGVQAEDWNMCEEDVEIYRTETDFGRELLSVYDEQSNLWFEAVKIAEDDCPPNVLEVVQQVFPDLPVYNYWQTVNPDEDRFLFEFMFDSGEMFSLLVTKTGELQCKGFQY